MAELEGGSCAFLWVVEGEAFYLADAIYAYMRRKVAAVSVSLLIMVSSIVILVEIAEKVEAPTTLYVGGGGGGNYSKIQWAIDNASDGDTVFVYNGTYYENVVVNKGINLTGISWVNTTIDGGGIGDVVRIVNNSITMTNFTVVNGGSSSDDAGIKLDQVENCRIMNNNASSNRRGISLFLSTLNLIKGNTFMLNGDSGIYLEASNQNTIIDNNASENGNYGINIRYSDWNIVSDNYAFSHRYGSIRLHHSTGVNLMNNSMGEGGIIIFGSLLRMWTLHTIESSNTVSGKPVYFWKNRTGGIVPTGAGQIILANSSNVRVENQEISYSSVGIELGFSSNNNIINNNVSFCKSFGIYLVDSDWNNVTENRVISNDWGIVIDHSKRNNITYNNASSNNIYGIDIYYASENNVFYNNVSDNGIGINILSDFSKDNLVYYNNILGNGNQANDDGNNYWDNGFPLGGNYWEDYNGMDLNTTPKQDVPPSDGLGDSPYAIDFDSRDNYPLMGPYTPRIFENYTILNQGWNLISIPLIQEDQNLTKVLGMIDGYYNALQWYDKTDPSDPWKHNKIGKPFGNDLSKLNETMSFWIHITQPGDTIFLYNGSTPTSNQTIQLHPGWNMVGYPSLTSYNRTTGLNNLTFDTHVDCIQWYDAVSKTWHFMDQDDYFVPGRGYWMHSKVDVEWEVPL
jgi:parallel beta-helix repeat protein